MLKRILVLVGDIIADPKIVPCGLAKWQLIATSLRRDATSVEKKEAEDLSGINGPTIAPRHAIVSPLRHLLSASLCPLPGAVQ